MSGFLLVVIAATFAGDSVAGDSAWGNLRYLLMRPVPRGRLLLAKAIVAGVLIWAATIVVALAALVGGVVIFGAHPVTVPALGPFATGSLATGFQLGRSALLLRLALGTVYVSFGFTALLAIGTFFSVLTDTATGAIGATAGVYIVSEILDGISQLGRIRYFFPTHYFAAWETMFTDNRYSHDMVTGIVVQLAYLAVFGGAAIVWFRRKDIRS
jgi:ABC-2 type transport system permease protein